MALGASGSDVVRGVVREGMVLTVTGLLVGVGFGLALSRLLAAMLYGVEPFDPVTYGCVVALLFVVATAAALVPARRAAGVNPVEVLRG
jgi:putative ABC transport system permease protein